MIPRFLQLFILASLILLIPSLLYLSHGPDTILIDPTTGKKYSPDSLITQKDGRIADNPLAQLTQGNGVEFSRPPDDSKGNTDGGGGIVGAAWGWKNSVGNAVKRPVEKVEDAWAKWVGGLKSGTSSKEALDEAFKDASQGKGKVSVSDAEVGSTNPDGEAPLGGEVIMSKMGNATAKAALGRSTWHFLHTMTLRFPDKPTKEQSQTLKTFFHLFAQLYPCGDCARHFQKLLKELPPQTSSRMSAALWLCSAHNMVNKRLGKEEFPCDKLDESYDCGCGPEDPKSTATTTPTTTSTDPTPDPASSSVVPDGFHRHVWNGQGAKKARGEQTWDDRRVLEERSGPSSSSPSSSSNTFEFDMTDGLDLGLDDSNCRCSFR
ncbi:hypothetical protein IE53DRAFT_369954 [Violaceomyces palustris]|uniref:Uncharacterized protein n=1 Tax=Violaceomyces palustris TaxID=1673888 RepID=A0ACD0NTQ9_9BASI|nr:hypothetical protein IE53DRAFT_369954 [Violaceomyces palustris]